jgi:hypothetical protein
MPQLNLMLHGTWGIEENDNGIRVATIHDHHHHDGLVAGNRDAPAYPLLGAGTHHDASQDHPTKEYTLQGVTPGDGTQRFKHSQNAIVKGPRHAKNVAVLIDLEHPREIHSVRRAKTPGHSFFENGVPEIGPELAVAQVLVYEVPDLSKVILQPKDGSLGLKVEELGSPDGNNDVVNLHVFASPRTEEDLPKIHFIEVFQALAGAFGFVITPLEKDRSAELQGTPLDRDMTPEQMLDVPPDLNDANIAGLNWRDTVSLHELRPRPAVSPANCNMCVFKNRADTALFTAD